MANKKISETLVERFSDEVDGVCKYSNAACELEASGYRSEAEKMLDMAKAEMEHAKTLCEMILKRMSSHVSKAESAIG